MQNEFEAKGSENNIETMQWYFYLFCVLAGVMSFLISYIFLRIETKSDKIFPGKQLLVQMVVFVGLYLFGDRIFEQITLNIFSLELSWFWAFLLIETVV